MPVKTKMELLSGDASTRKYYRVLSDSGTKVLMQDEPFDKNSPIVRCNRFFKALGIRVPEMYETDYEKGTILQEDVGSLHLQDVSDKAQLKRCYDEALDIMLLYQTAARSFDVSFTKEKFISELVMTNEYYSQSSDKRLLPFFNELVDEMMKQAQLFLHRDYHSRNLMVKNGHLVVIDYQDARMGPFTYDLASLTIDPYIKLTSDITNELVEKYYDGIKDVVGVNSKEYKRYYELCYLQRGIKILGTYAYQKIKKGNSGYMRYIPPSVEKIRSVLGSFPEWRRVVLEAVIK
ncbi:MAG: phosphotransferase [Pseudomonadota bacterium]